MDSKIKNEQVKCLDCNTLIDALCSKCSDNRFKNMLETDDLECGHQTIHNSGQLRDQYYCLRVKGHTKTHVGISLGSFEEGETSEDWFDARESSVIATYGLATTFIQTKEESKDELPINAGTTSNTVI